MFQVRLAKPEDALDIYEVEQACFSVPWSLASIEEELVSPGRLYVVIEVNGQIIGYGGSWMVLDEGQITNIAIVPAHRREGYGAIMTRKLVKELIGKGMKEIFLEVRVSNGPAQALYRRLGFTTKGHRKDYYTEPVEDAYIMSLQVEEEA